MASKRLGSFGKGTRATKAQVAARIEHIEDLYYVRLLERAAIERMLSSEWKVTERQIRAYITKGWRRRAKQAAEGSGPEAISKERYRESLIDLYNRALDAKDFSAADRIHRRLGRLEGHETPPQLDVHHSGTVGHVVVTAEQLAEALEQASPAALDGLKLLAGRLLPK